MSKDKKNKAGTQVPQGQFVFGKQNYQLMLIGLAVIILGFVLMHGKEGDIYDFRRITLAPIVVMAGFVIEIFAILRKPKSE
jgi:hypothetical protein